MSLKLLPEQSIIQLQIEYNKTEIAKLHSSLIRIGLSLVLHYKVNQNSKTMSGSVQIENKDDGS